MTGIDVNELISGLTSRETPSSSYPRVTDRFYCKCLSTSVPQWPVMQLLYMQEQWVS